MNERDNEHIQAAIKAIEYMKKHLDEEVTTELLAEHVGYSQYHFSRIFKEVTGISPRRFLSALRIEAGKEQLMKSAPSSILHTMLTIGFRSLGTFSSRFKQFVGTSPRDFRMRAAELHLFLNDYDSAKKQAESSDEKPCVICNIEKPEHFKGVLFVGLFPRAIPDQKPIMGNVLGMNQKCCRFSNVPSGSYYVLAAALKWSFHPKDYFILEKALRGRSDSILTISEDSNVKVTITLREPLPYDPPILVNLPELLFEKENSKREEKA